MSALKKCKNGLRAFVKPKINFKINRKILVLKGLFIVQLHASVLSGVIGSLISNN
jgi:hypothetical protein